jgi:aspartyl-tRNA(Asn)/glutamyl-tRNA(Gln) amidotransferase subunit B
LQGPSSKLFSRAPGSIEARTLQPNEAVDDFDAALPGTYPKLNQASVDHAIRAAIALGSKVSPISVFERKVLSFFFSSV